MRYFIDPAGLGYALVADRQSELTLRQDGWREVGLSEFLARRARKDAETDNLRFFIRADGQYAAIPMDDDLRAASLVSNEFYEVDSDDYYLFAKRHSVHATRQPAWANGDGEPGPGDMDPQGQGDDDVDQGYEG